MNKWIVTGTSMVTEAETAEEAIERAEQSSGWHWEATEVDKQEKTYTAEDIGSLINLAMNDIDDFADMPDEGARDALNLLINVVVTRAEKPAQKLSVEDVIGTNYDADPDTVRGWIES